MTNPGKTTGAQAQHHIDQAFLLTAKEIVADMSNTDGEGMVSLKSREKAVNNAKTLTAMIPFLDHSGGMARNGSRIDE